MSKISLIVPLAEGRVVEGIKEIEEQKGIRLIRQYGNNPSKNRNIGVEKARTELVAFINGHTFLDINWHKNVHKFFLEHHDIDIVGGPQLSYDDNFFAKASNYALSSIFGAANVRKRYKPGKLSLDADETCLTSANLICKKKVFKKVKFDEKLYPGEDPKFISDAKQKGLKVAYSPNILVYNRKRGNLSSLAKQVFNYGRMRPKKESLAETLKRPFFLAPSLFLVYLAFLPLLCLLGKFWLIPLFIYLLLDFLFSIYEGCRNKDYLAIPYLIILFPSIHLSYGLGFITGFVSK
jgi:hypothetical protein